MSTELANDVRIADRHILTKPFVPIQPPTAEVRGFGTDLPAYAIDAKQRAVLFLDLLRQRGNEELDMTSRPMATVLRYKDETIMSGRSLERPTDYTLSRILPPSRVVSDEHKRPVVVIDPLVEKVDQHVAPGGSPDKRQRRK